MWVSLLETGSPLWFIMLYTFLAASFSSSSGRVGKRKCAHSLHSSTHLKVLMEIPQDDHFTKMASRERSQVKALWFFLAFPAKFKFRESYLPLLEILSMISLNYISFLILFMYFIYFRAYEMFFVQLFICYYGFFLFVCFIRIWDRQFYQI